jgi:hypothetical protein
LYKMFCWKGPVLKGWKTEMAFDQGFVAVYP